MEQVQKKTRPFNRDIARHLRFLAVGLAVVCAFAQSAAAQTLIDPNQSVGAVPDYAGAGLSGTYSNTNVDDNALLATFTAANICFPDCAGSTFGDGSGGLVAFTNGQATNIDFLVPSDQIPTTWNSSNLNLSGYIAITQPGTYLFSLGSDDTSTLTIGSDLLINQPCCGTTTGSADFTAAGLYPILVQFMEFGGGSYLNLEAYSPQDACIIGCTSNTGIEDSGLFYLDAQLQGAPTPIVGGGLYSLAILAAGMMIRHRKALMGRTSAPFGFSDS